MTLTQKNLYYYYFLQNDKLGLSYPSDSWITKYRPRTRCEEPNDWTTLSEAETTFLVPRAS